MRHKFIRKVRAKGRDYFYFNTGRDVNGKTVWKRLPDANDPSFWPTYGALLGHRNRRPASVLTVPKLIDLYQKSTHYRTKLADGTRSRYDIYLRRFAEMMPTAPAAEITRADMRRLVDGMAETPGAANLFLGTCGALFAWAAKHEYITASPTKGIDLMEMGEHEPWPKHLLEAALGSDDKRVRLLTHLLYFTALRINDALALTWSNIEGDRLVVRPQKARRRRQELSIRIHRDLRAELETVPRDALVIAINPATGRKWTDAAARKALQEFATGLGEKVVPHGLRKNAVNALLEVGCSVAETASISGQSLQLVEHYAKRRDQAKLGDAAVLRWERNGR